MTADQKKQDGLQMNAKSVNKNGQSNQNLPICAYARLFAYELDSP